MKTVITLDDEKFGGNYYHAAHVEVIRGDKTRSAKYVDVDRLLEAMKNARNVDVFYRIGRLPQNYYDGTIRRESDMTISGHMLLTVSKQRIPLQFEETKYTIPFPALLFCFHIIHGRVCLLGGELRETQTANYFSNFSPVDCAVPSANA